MTDTKLIQKFDELIRHGRTLLPIEGDDAEYCARRDKWETKCQVALEKTFGKNSVYLKKFQGILYYADVEHAITSGIAIMEGAKEELDSWEKTDNKLDKIQKEIGEEKAEAERRAAVVETKLWGSVIELIDMQREELRKRSQINQEILEIHREIDEIKTLLSKMISSQKESAQS
jgi:hypothetical protein